MPASFPSRARIDAVCFDAFGTLVEITDPRQVGRTMLRSAKPAARNQMKARLLRENRPLKDWPTTAHDGTQLMDDLCAELGSIRMRPRLHKVWRDLRCAGFKLGVCSNLAAPYGPGVLSALPDAPDSVVFSYLVGHAKPEPEIYAKVLAELRTAAERILFVGDTKSADVDGPAKAGMQSMLIDEFMANAA